MQVIDFYLSFPSYWNLKFMELLANQKSSFSIVPVLKGLNKIKKVNKPFKTS